MIRFLFLILTVTFVTQGAPHPQSGTEGVDDDIFGDDNDVHNCDVEGDIFDDCEETPKEECKPKEKMQFLIDLRTSLKSGNDCNKTAKCADYEGFSCVPFWQCKNKTSNVIQDGFGLIDLREDQEEDCVHKTGTLDASDDKCPESENEVCCENSNPEAKICPIIKPMIKPTTKGVLEPEQPVVRIPTVTTNEPVTLPSYYDCGRTGSKTKVTHLKDPNAAQPGEFTHMCVVYKKIGNQRVYLGGASLIDKNKVISVAHKFYVKHGEANTVDERENVENLLVRCGEYNVKTEAELLEYQETSVVAIHFHPLYKPEELYLPNNLVILETKWNFIYQDHIGPVCLPKPGDDFKNAECWSSGWGKDQFGSNGYYSDVLKKVAMPIVDNSECEPAIRGALIERGGGSDFQLDESHLCIGGVEDKDTCTGDGGSPHSCKIDGKWTQVGTVAWGIGCGSEIPAIYSSIPDAMCWINHLLGCVLVADTNVEGEPDEDDDRIDLRQVGDCADGKYGTILRGCTMYEKQQSFDRDV